MALGHTDISMCYERYVQRSTDVFRAAQRKFSEIVLRAAPANRSLVDFYREPTLVA